MAFIRVGPIVRSLLASVIIQWESLQETSTRNNPKSLGITLRLLNIINRVIFLRCLIYSLKKQCFFINFI